MTLHVILRKIFSEQLFDLLFNNYFDSELEEVDQILNNEIVTWLSTIESLHSSVHKIIFIKPDYNEALFYELKYKYESNSITIEEIISKLKPYFSLEREFLDTAVKILVQLLNHKGDLSSIGLQDFQGRNRSRTIQSSFLLLNFY